ncbi:hypothetical protein AKJ16_DCAP13076 [Drosera capensis]
MGTVMAQKGRVEDVVIQEGPCLTIAQQESLVHPFSAAKVKAALWDIDDDKSPGIDSYTVAFFKNVWPIVGLDHFATTSNLEVNTSKSLVFLGGVLDTQKDIIASILGIELGTLLVKYLGVPLTSKKLKNQQYGVLIEKITKRITSWFPRLLSYAGRVQLIKSVLMTVHLYWGQISLIPAGVMEDVAGNC